jgi:hypothetical protein
MSMTDMQALKAEALVTCVELLEPEMILDVMCRSRDAGVTVLMTMPSRSS